MFYTQKKVETNTNTNQPRWWPWLTLRLILRSILCIYIRSLSSFLFFITVKCTGGWQSHLRTHLWQLQHRKSFDFTLFTHHELCASSIFLTLSFATSLSRWNNRIDWCTLDSTHTNANAEQFGAYYMDKLNSHATNFYFTGILWASVRHICTEGKSPSNYSHQLNQ